MEEYFLEVVKEGIEPKWPRPKEELIINSQSLEDGFIQFWAYPKDQKISLKIQKDLPPAEEVAQDHPTPHPAVLIDQIKNSLELIYVRDGHAWAKTESNIENLEGNLATLLDLVQERFGAKINHFLTTDRVNRAVEDKLNELAEGDESESMEMESEKEELEEDNGKVDEEGLEIRKVGMGRYDNSRDVLTPRNNSSQSSSLSKLWAMLPVVVILVIFIGVIVGREKIINKFFKSQAAVPAEEVAVTPTITLTPSPTPNRADYQLRVLNGTLKTGAAKSLAEELEVKGWKVKSFGNAKNQNAPQTQIKVKPGKEEVAATLINDLTGSLEATLAAQLEEDDLVDLEVTIGKK